MISMVIIFFWSYGTLHNFLSNFEIVSGIYLYIKYINIYIIVLLSGSFTH